MHIKKRMLLTEIDILLQNNIIDSATAEKINAYYLAKFPAENKENQNRLLNILISTGAVLVGLGIILLVAHNWDMLSVSTRVSIAIVPIVCLQAVILFGKIKNYNSPVFTESTSALLSLMLGASIAIISQTYQIQGSFEAFLQTWMLLLILLVYNMRSNIAGFIYFVLTILWVTSEQNAGGAGVLFWFFGFLILPYTYFFVIKKDMFSSSSFFFCNAFVIWLLSSVGIALEKAVPGLWIIIYSLLVLILYFSGIRWFNKTGPFYFLGKLGTLFMSYLFSYKFFWEAIGIRNFRIAERFNNAGAVSDYIILAILLIIFAYMCIKYFNLIKTEIGVPIILPILAAISFFICGYDESLNFIVVLEFSFFTLALGIYSIYLGIKNKDMFETNIGMLLIGILIVTKFLDFDFSFLERAIAFIILGMLFILANVFIKSKLGAKNEKKI